MQSDLIKELSTNFIEYAASVNILRRPLIMCDFCNNIINEEDYRKKNPYDRVNCLIKINSYDYGLWIECEDWYYSGVKM